MAPFQKVTGIDRPVFLSVQVKPFLDVLELGLNLGIFPDDLSILLAKLVSTVYQEPVCLANVAQLLRHYILLQTGSAGCSSLGCPASISSSHSESRASLGLASGTGGKPSSSSGVNIRMPWTMCTSGSRVLQFTLLPRIQTGSLGSPAGFAQCHASLTKSSSFSTSGSGIARRTPSRCSS